MGKKSRRSREQIMTKRHRRAEVAGYSALQRLLMGGRPLEEFDEEVQAAITYLDQLDQQLGGRGWVYEEEYGFDGALSWRWPPSEVSEEVLYAGEPEDSPERERVTSLGLYLDGRPEGLPATFVLSPVGGGARLGDDIEVPRTELDDRLPAIEALRFDSTTEAAR